MDDRELKELLQRIPRESAPPDFSARLGRRLDAADRRIRVRRRVVPALAFAATIVIAAGAGLLYSWQRQQTQRAARVEQARLASLELEYRDIEEELVELQRMVAAARPVVGIEGSSRDRGYLVDVGELARARAEGTVPVAYRLPH